MSKNFRSSFIDLLCCRYSKRNLYGAHETSRNRRMTDNSYNNRTSLFGKSDYLIRGSVLSGFSQLNPMTTAIGPTTSTSLSRLTNGLSRMRISNDERKISMESNIPRHITVELNERHQQRKQSDRSPVVSYCSLMPKPLEVLCT